MKLSVIILNYNVRYFLEHCILTVKEALVGIESEIIVVDNNSTDGSCEMITENFPEVILIRNPENLGFSKANNQGVSHASGEYICILNPDTAVSKEAFSKSLEYAEDHPDCGALGVKLIDGTGNFLPESKRRLPRPKVAFLKMAGIKSKKHSYYATHIAETGNGKTDVLVGAFMLMKKDRFDQVGGFDEDYFMYGEDIDLSYKLLKAGYANYYFGETTVLHYKGESTTRDKEYTERFYGAMLIFYRKHFGTNPLGRTVVTLGVSLARLGRFFSKNEASGKSKPERCYLLSDNIGFLKKLSKAVDAELKSISKSSVSDGGIYNSRLIFDANYISYAQMFRIMQLLKNKGNTFRIRPVNTNFIIGSDSSTSKGEVLSID